MPGKDTPTTATPALLYKQYAHLLVPAGIAVVTWLVLRVCLKNQFTNWDDIDYVLGNPLIKDTSPAGLSAIFSTPVMGNYHPLTILSYAIEYAISGYEPALYHFDSLVLHVAATLMVYWFVVALTGRRAAAAVTALLFGLHPMHVESVAWISGRKDELCAIFYFMACIGWLHYLRPGRGKKYWYAAVLALFVLALLSKPTSVALPLVLLLLDYFEGRARSRGMLIEKIPFFLISLVFGIIAVRAQYGIGAVNVGAVHFSAIERVALGSYALITYLWKAVVPAQLCCFYPYPEKVNGALPFLYYLYPLAVIAIVLILWKFARKNKAAVFGLLFFIINIVLLLQFIPVGNAILADRYSYIPYAGLFFIAGWFVSEYMARSKSPLANPVMVVSALYLLALGYNSMERCKVWYYPISLWTDELAKQPNVQEGYVNLGSIYYNLWANATDPAEKQATLDSAFYLMKRSVELCPDSSGEYQALGMLYYTKHEYDSADLCFKTYLRLKPSPDAIANYGNFLVMMGRNDSAIKQYETALSQNPDLYAPYFNLGKILRKRNRCDEAIKDFSAAIALNPRFGELYYERSFCDTQVVGKALALRDVETAISLGFSRVDTGYYNWLKGK